MQTFLISFLKVVHALTRRPRFWPEAGTEKATWLDFDIAPVFILIRWTPWREFCVAPKIVGDLRLDLRLQIPQN